MRGKKTKKKKQQLDRKSDKRQANNSIHEKLDKRLLNIWRHNFVNKKIKSTLGYHFSPTSLAKISKAEKAHRVGRTEGRQAPLQTLSRQTRRCWTSSVYPWLRNSTLWATLSVTSFPDRARREFLRHNSGGPHTGLSLSSAPWSLTEGPLWSVASWPRHAVAILSAAQRSCVARGSLTSAPRQPSSLYPWHSHGTAINYARCVHFQFKCVPVPEEQLMASSYWCEKSLPLLPMD